MVNTGSDAVIWDGMPYRKNVILADINIPYKLTIDRKNNNLFFCINADEYSDQSFQSVLFNLDTGLATIIPGIRNGFASAVDQLTGDVYLGGSNGIYKYDYATNDIVQPPLVENIDIFDMYFNDNLYYENTGSQSLHVYQNKRSCVININGALIEHFVIDVFYDLYYVNRSGVFVITTIDESPVLLANDIEIRGAATDVNGTPYFIANDGVYGDNKERKTLYKILELKNGNGLAFDKNNYMLFCEDRSIVGLLPN